MNFTALKTALTTPLNFTGMTFMGMNVTKMLDPVLGSLEVYLEMEAPESGRKVAFKTAFKWIVKTGVPYLWAERGPLLGYIHMILAALFPIYIGSHASLRCPSSAGPKKVEDEYEDDDDIVIVEPTIEGLSPSDAIMLPVLAGGVLGGLYLLIRWMDDPAFLNKILGWYFSLMGIFGVAKLAADSLGVGTSFIFPSVWSSNLRTYHVEPLLSVQVTGEVHAARREEHREIVSDMTNPLPGRLLSSIKFSESTTKKLWAIRGLLRNHWIFRMYIHNLAQIKTKIQLQDVTGFFIGVAAIILYNTWDKVWFLTNLIGFAFCYGTLQLLSPTTFWTGSLVLAGLFIYDITMVFYTPLMVTVATTLDVPIKLVFPGPAGTKGSMLGLGDVVLPGIMMALALRYDLYLHYLRKQTKVPTAIEPAEVHSTAAAASETIIKAPYVEATGVWGERFWTWGATDTETKTAADGGRFAKVYFTASIIGYITGMVATLIVLRIFNHAQPALLYLVPGVLIALWGTAVWREEFALMWGYTEEFSDEEGDEKTHKGSMEKGKAKVDESKSDKNAQKPKQPELQPSTSKKTHQEPAQNSDAYDLSPFSTDSEESSSSSSDPEDFGPPVSGKKVLAHTSFEDFAKGYKEDVHAKRDLVRKGEKGKEGVEKGEREKEKEVGKKENSNAQHVFLFSLSAPKMKGFRSPGPRKAVLFEKD